MFFTTRLHQHFPLPKLTPAFIGLDLSYSSLGSWLHYLHYILYLSTGLFLSAKKHLQTSFLLQTSPWTLIETSTIIHCLLLYRLFLRRVYTHCLPSLSSLCLTPKSLKMISSPSFSWPHSWLQPARNFPNKKSSSPFPFHTFILLWPCSHSSLYTYCLLQPRPPLAQVLLTFQVQIQALQLKALTPSELYELYLWSLKNLEDRILT